MIAWASIDQQKRGRRAQPIPRARMLAIVTVMFSAPRIELVPGQVDEEDPRVGPVARDVGPRGERGVRRPARLRGTEEDRGVEHGSAGEVEPIRQRVEPREGHVARPHLQRHEVVREAGPQRHDHEEDHRRAVHREHLVVDLRRQQRVVGLGELGAHQQRLDSAERHERERRDQVEHADPLVIGRRSPSRPTRGRPRARRGERRFAAGAAGACGTELV